MAAPKRRSAIAVYWISPLGQRCSLVPLTDSHGILEVDIIDTQVVIHGRNCQHASWTKHRNEADENTFSELEISVPITQCQINWHLLERKESEEIERSIHFRD